MGLCVVLLLAGIQKIPPSLYDAARVDGAGWFAELRAVTLPGLRNEMLVAITFTLIIALRIFDIVFVTTKGGPGEATYVPTLWIYPQAFQYGFVGSAAALAVVIDVIIMSHLDQHEPSWGSGVGDRSSRSTSVGYACWCSSARSRSGRSSGSSSSRSRARRIGSEWTLSNIRRRGTSGGSRDTMPASLDRGRRRRPHSA